MKLVIQRVTSASVAVSNTVVGQIGQGLCVLVGISKDDTLTDLDYAMRKILNVRLFTDPATGKHWTKSVTDIDGGILLVSQFTLCHVLKGNKPDFHNAMSTKDALDMFNTMVAQIGTLYNSDRIATGQFGAYMDVHISNDGPVTLHIDSKEKNSRAPS
jgi:D-aminoacyl-tRNA deacylase